MAIQLFQKGKFYTLPIKDIKHEGSNSFFIVSADNKEYPIRMFGFQKKRPRNITKERTSMHGKGHARRQHYFRTKLYTNVQQQVYSRKLISLHRKQGSLQS